MHRKQAKLLKFLRAYRERHMGAVPTLARIREALGVRDAAPVESLIAGLKRRGVLPAAFAPAASQPKLPEEPPIDPPGGGGGEPE